MSLDWNSIDYFVSLVEHQTLTATADKLGVQHSTVSRQIEGLEKQLKIRLFDRINKRYLLTEDGKRLYQQAREIYKDIQVLQRLAHEQIQAMHEVVVSVSPLLGQVVLAPHLAEFCRRYPQIRLVLQSTSNVSNLHQRQADIALRIPPPEQGDLVVRRLFDIHVHLYAQRDYLLKHKPDEWQFIGVKSHGMLEYLVENLLADRKVVLMTNDFITLKQLILQQVGIGVLPDFYVSPSDNLSIVTLPEKQSSFHAQLHMVMHEDVRRSPYVRAVADFLVEKLGD
ncbi:LysR family transcriptional regulator [Lonepinella sp. BR2271]|uniref:LysR family transcriptional regulator n=1 Tax=Lonepinella sp. BR2271 TaxID=3434550 RepID=UPI003F6E2F46